MTPDVADILDRAADLIEPEGRWIQGTWVHPGSWAMREKTGALCFCVQGALAMALGIYPVMVRDTKAAAILSSVAGVLPHRITDWNDAPERTQAEVVQALRTAATLSRKGTQS